MLCYIECNIDNMDGHNVPCLYCIGLNSTTVRNVDIENENA